MLQVYPVPILNDNYTWIIKSPDSTSVYVVDPGESGPVIQYLEEKNWSIEGLLITHSHRDHVGGIDAVLERFPAPVIGPKCPAIKQVTQIVNEHSQLCLWDDISVQVIETPGHLPEHICFFIPDAQQNLLFCGDILFSSGCGRNFVGTAEEFLTSLKKLSKLPGDCYAYCAHEYTLANIAFALNIEPNNQDLIEKRQLVQAKREAGLPSLPTTIADELNTNPFMRCHLPSVKQQAEAYIDRSIVHESEVFGALRKWKDHF